MSGKEIEEAIAKAVELRALHTALMNHKNSPSHLKFLSPSLLSRPSTHFSAHDYPIFTPSYEDESLQGCGHLRMPSHSIFESWDDIESNNRRGENQMEVHEDASSRKELTLDEHHICPGDDSKSVASANTIHVKRRAILEDAKSVSSCNKCKPATIETDRSDCQSGNSTSQNKSRGLIMSWLFPRSKRRQKNENGSGSPLRSASEDVSQVLKDLGLGIVSVETLKKQLIESNQTRDAAVKQVSDMKTSFEELKKKLEYLESHCDDLKKALFSLNKRDSLMMPVTDEVMVEGFLQIVAESRLSIKQFCKTLFRQIDLKDEQLIKNINLLLNPYKLSFNNTSKHSKPIFYHLAGIINQSLYQDFENCVFQTNGTPKFLDPHQDRQKKFKSFMDLRNLSWNEVLKKGAKYYSEDFSKFCDQKMNTIIVTLNWTTKWPESLLQSFFVAAKCVWLLHLLAFSFNPPLNILRVDENRSFDARYMEDVFKDKHKGESPCRVKIMVMPGFYVHDRILRCKVVCRYKSVA